MKRALWFVIAVAAVVLAALAVVAASMHAYAAATNKVALYAMNEGPRQRVLHDEWNGLNGTIGDKIERNGRYLHFDKVPFETPLDLELTARVYSDDLNPGDGRFAVTWRARTDKIMRFGNVMQKGQGSPDGGMFKFRYRNMGTPELRVQCFWRGDIGGSSTWTPEDVNIKDGRWHVIRCVKTDTGTRMLLDGELVDTDSAPGTIANTWPLSIGGNVTSCREPGGTTRHCNWWAGDLDWIRFTR